jgi:hypothetical protein
MGVLWKLMVPLTAVGLNKEALTVSSESKETKDSLNKDNFEGSILMKKKQIARQHEKKKITSEKKYIKN